MEGALTGTSGGEGVGSSIMRFWRGGEEKRKRKIKRIFINCSPEFL
jgi:hypothetical protein